MYGYKKANTIKLYINAFDYKIVQKWKSNNSEEAMRNHVYYCAAYS